MALVNKRQQLLKEIFLSMKKTSILKCIAASLSAVTLFAFSGCELIGLGTGNNDTPNPAIYISQTEISLAVGDCVQLNATATDGSIVFWESSNAAVATVVEGFVTGISEGEATIMASTDSVLTTCTIKVNKAPDSNTNAETLVLSIANLSLEVGNSVTLTATSSDATAQIIWDSSNKTVATVANGKVTAKAVGKTTITANTGTAIAGCDITVTQGLPENSYKDGFELVWFDEFNGTSLDMSKWGYQTGTQDQYGTATGASYWGNGEHQYYTQDAVSVADGSLKITAKRQAMGDRPYTSGRILTRDKASWTYGYFEAKIKSPTGSGMWPAFWMLPQPSAPNSLDNQYGGWPNNGEIDIMEAKGRLMNKVDTTIHFGQSWPNNQYLSGTATLTSNIDQWHTYALEWTADYLAWFADGKQVYKLTNSQWWTPSSSAASAPFDKPFYILLNLAVGGTYDYISENNYAQPDASFTSASMYVDYVRVYKAV